MKKTLPHPELRVYRDENGEYRWRLVSTNHRIVADSGESYMTRAGAKRSAVRLWVLVRDAEICPI